MAPLRRLSAASLLRLLALLVLLGIGVAACDAGVAPGATQPNPAAALVPAEQAAVVRAEAAVAVRLPTGSDKPAPSLPPGAFSRPLPAHQVVGFLPYWEVAGFTPAVSELTTLVYWSVSLAAGGALTRSGQGYTTLSSPALGIDVLRAHQAGDRVLLTVFSTSNRVIATVTSHPGSAGRRLAKSLAPLLTSGDFDGVDLDIEGDSTPGRPGFVRFVAAFSAALASLDARWSIMLDTYPASAFDSTGFFDIKALAPHVDEMFVMAYEMQQPGIASPTAPLFNSPLNDAMALAEYTSVVPASKVVLGIPLYGYDYQVGNRSEGAAVIGTPVAVTYQDVVAAGHTATWDPLTETPVTVFRRKGHWHQTFFDDPVSIALKTALAEQFRCAGVGVWDLGMSGGNPSVLAALLGGRPPLKLPLAGTAGQLRRLR